MISAILQPWTEAVSPQEWKIILIAGVLWFLCLSFASVLIR